jgi:hypothetical protein
MNSSELLDLRTAYQPISVRVRLNTIQKKERRDNSMDQGNIEILRAFADRHGLPMGIRSVSGPLGEIYAAPSGNWLISRRGGEFRKFDPITQAQQGIEAIGLQYKAPPKTTDTDRTALLIVKETDGWYVVGKTGPFKTRDLARIARESLKNKKEMSKQIT